MVEVFKSKCLDVLEATSVRWLTHKFVSAKETEETEGLELKTRLEEDKCTQSGTAMAAEQSQGGAYEEAVHGWRGEM